MSLNGADGPQISFGLGPTSFGGCLLQPNTDYYFNLAQTKDSQGNEIGFDGSTYCSAPTGCVLGTGFGSLTCKKNGAVVSCNDISKGLLR